MSGVTAAAIRRLYRKGVYDTVIALIEDKTLITPALYHKLSPLAMEGHAKLGNIDRALNILKDMQNSPDITINAKYWRIIADEGFRAHRIQDVYQLLKNKPDPNAPYAEFALKMAYMQDFQSMRQILNEMYRVEGNCDVITFRKLIGACAKYQNREEPYRLWKDMKRIGVKKDISVYNAMMNAISSDTEYKTILDLYEEIKNNDDIQPDHITFKTMLKFLARNKQTDTLRQIFDSMPKYGFEHDNEDYNLVVSSACSDCFELFDKMKILKLQRTPYTYKAIVYACLDLKNYNKITEIIQDIKKNNIKICFKTWKLILKVCEISLDFHQAEIAFHEMTRRGYKPDVMAINSLLQSCNSAEAFGNIRKIFDKFYDYKLTPDMKSFNTAISACQWRNNPKAVYYARSMIKFGMYPSDENFELLLKICNHNNLMKDAVSLVSDRIDKHLRISSSAFTSLILLLEKEQVSNDFILKWIMTAVSFVSEPSADLFNVAILVFLKRDLKSNARSCFLKMVKLGIAPSMESCKPIIEKMLENHEYKFALELMTASNRYSDRIWYESDSETLAQKWLSQVESEKGNHPHLWYSCAICESLLNQDYESIKRLIHEMRDQKLELSPCSISCALFAAVKLEDSHLILHILSEIKSMKFLPDEESVTLAIECQNRCKGVCEKHCIGVIRELGNVHWVPSVLSSI